jgi:hypothetical protein
VLALTAVVIAADNNVGTWKLNLAKSKYSPGPAPKSQTLRIEAWGDDGVKYAADGVGADGKPTHAEFHPKYDGKGYPFKGNPDADMLSYKQIDANTLEATTKLNGKHHYGEGRGLRGRQDANRDPGGHECAGPGASHHLRLREAIETVGNTLFLGRCDPV